MKRLLATIALLPGLVMAQSTPVGVWKTIDDDGKTAKSIVRVTETGGVLSAVIEKVLDPKAANRSASHPEVLTPKRDWIQRWLIFASFSLSP
jgi:hypothetical protein